MEDFAQTRGPDDLFESEISAQPSSPVTTLQEPRGNTFGRGRVNQSYVKGYYQHTRDGNQQMSEIYQDIQPSEKNDVVEPSTAPSTAEGPSTPLDRTLSGGLKKPKLTDEELAVRMARVKLNNQRLTERRRKAEEDETKFQAQEEERKQNDAVKRLAERKKKIEQEKNRRELDDEREKNRQRKLKAVQNREWDSEKKEEDYNPGGYSQKYKKGAYGGLPRARINCSNNTNSKTTVSQESVAVEWPTLPENKYSASKERKTDLPALSPATGGSSWAEQVEAGSPVTSSR